MVFDASSTPCLPNKDCTHGMNVFMIQSLCCLLLSSVLESAILPLIVTGLILFTASVIFFCMSVLASLITDCKRPAASDCLPCMANNATRCRLEYTGSPRLLNILLMPVAVFSATPCSSNPRCFLSRCRLLN